MAFIKCGSALLLVMVSMSWFMLLLTGWWQAVGWNDDLALVRQQSIVRFYATEVVRNYAVAWIKQTFKQIKSDLIKINKPLILDIGKINLCSGQNCNGRLIVDHIPRDKLMNIIRLTTTLMLDGKKITCHRCLIEHTRLSGEQRFIVHHVAFR